MKGLAILAAIVILLFGAAAFWLMHETSADQGVWVAYAFGAEGDGKIEMHIALDMGMTLKEHPLLSPKGDPMWDEWVAEHFIMCDESGTALEASRSSFSPFISAEKAKGAAEWYIKYTLISGTQYTLDYKPRRAEEKRYRRVFAAPAAAEEMVRSQFPLFEEKAGK
ncbi:MAG: hypothetical protein ABII12_01205 [Planctomycetota bacterium]